MGLIDEMLTSGYTEEGLPYEGGYVGQSYEDILAQKMIDEGMFPGAGEGHQMTNIPETLYDIYDSPAEAIAKSTLDFFAPTDLLMQIAEGEDILKNVGLVGLGFIVPRSVQKIGKAIGPKIIKAVKGIGSNKLAKISTKELKATKQFKALDKKNQENLIKLQKTTKQETKKIKKKYKLNDDDLIKVDKGASKKIKALETKSGKKLTQTEKNKIYDDESLNISQKKPTKKIKELEKQHAAELEASARGPRTSVGARMSDYLAEQISKIGISKGFRGKKDIGSWLTQTPETPFKRWAKPDFLQRNPNRANIFGSWSKGPGPQKYEWPLQGGASLGDFGPLRKGNILKSLLLGGTGYGLSKLGGGEEEPLYSPAELQKYTPVKASKKKPVEGTPDKILDYFEKHIDNPAVLDSLTKHYPDVEKDLWHRIQTSY